MADKIKQLVILSGKGGTGKTSVAAAFAHLAYAGPSAVRAILADADVDAANLELVLHPQTLEKHEFMGGAVAVIDADTCNGCGLCMQVCRFEAVLHEGEYSIDPVACEGCAACVYQCPTEAIHMEAQLAGHWFKSASRYGPLFHAELLPAQENSGKLVTLVKQQARLLGLDEGYLLVIVDGPPGIGCPVISAAAGADLALVVAEPSAAGIHDMERALQTTAHFRVPSLVCINKADVHPAGAAQIEAYCREHGVDMVGHIPFDETVTHALVGGEPVTAYRPDASASRAMVEIWRRVAARLNGDEANHEPD
ncbi:MAG: ATP-binding protein [Thermoflexales bacterium]|nr:ATP-binding protein [Thermoflexales bacterium]